MGSPSLAQDDRRIRTRDRYAALHHRILHCAGCLFLAFCFISSASFYCCSYPPLSISSANSFSLRMFYLLAGFAFFSSLSGLVVAASQALCAVTHPSLTLLPSIDEEIAAQRRCLAVDLPRLAYGVIFLTLAAVFIAGAFVFGGLTTLQDVRSLRTSVIVPAAVGGFVILQALLLMLREMFLVWLRISKFDVHLWSAIKKETLFGYLAANYCSLFARNEEVTTEDNHAV